MISDSVESILDSIKERIRNPILGAYIISFVSWNWEFIYSLFNFDKDCTRLEKIAFISNYFNNHSKWSMILCPLVFAFISILIFIFANLSSGFLFDFARNHLKTSLQKRSGFKESDFAPASELIRLSRVNQQLENNNQTLIKNYGEASSKLREANASIEGGSKNIKDLEKQVETLKSQLQRANNKKFFELFPQFNSTLFKPLDIRSVFSGTWKYELISTDGSLSLEQDTFHIDNQGAFSGGFNSTTTNCVQNSKLIYFEQQSKQSNDIHRNYIRKIDENNYFGLVVSSKDGGRLYIVSYSKQSSN